MSILNALLRRDERGMAGHGHHVQHTPSADAATAYSRAFAAAEPAPGGKVARVDLNARETTWEFVAGTATKAWGYNGQTPGPVIEANIGDVLEVRAAFSCLMPAPSGITRTTTRRRSSSAA